VATFKEEESAEKALKEPHDIEVHSTLRYLDAVVIRREENEKLHIKETADPGGGKGAAAGGTISALIGVLAIPPGIVIRGAVGVLVGGVTARTIDSGIPDDRLELLAEHVSPGSSALAFISEVPFVPELKRDLEKAGGEVMITHIKPDIPDQLTEEETEVEEESSVEEESE
jgi:uncharacterized membrane protein